MRILVQRVLRASVGVNHRTVASIDHGLLCFVGFANHDESRINLNKAAQKLVDLRIFSDPSGKMNLSVRDRGGGILLVSQFTLYADTSRGNRPGFEKALKAQLANLYYSDFVEKVKQIYPHTQSGIFQAHMEISLINDGPVTLILEF